MAKLILPLSLFLGILITLSRMYAESEITVIHVCGLGKSILIRATLLLSLITSIFATINIAWLSPWSVRHQDLVMSEAKANPSMAVLINGQFKPTRNDNSVLFIGNVKDKDLEHVFLAQHKLNGSMNYTVVIANSGRMSRSQDGSQLVILDNGTSYEGTALQRNFRITHFTQYQAVIHHRAVTIDNTDVEQMSLCQLWLSSEPKARAELHWRFTLVISVLIMAMIVVPLSVVNPRQGQVLNMLPAILIYLIFFLLQTLLRTNGAKGKLDPMLWMWLINITHLILALVLNLWDSVPARRLRWRLQR